MINENVQIRKIYKNSILYIDNEMRAEYKSGLIFLKSNSSNQLIYRINLNESVKRKILSKFRFVERLLRFEPRYFDKLEEDVFIISYSGILCSINIKTGEKRELFRYAAGTKNPLYFCSYIRENKKEIVFSDYGGHDSQGNVGIYKYSEGRIAEIASIPGNLINHIHRVEYDQWRDCYWILTGDSDAGSGIWKLDYGKDYAEKILTGLQQYRAVVIYITESEIIYVTDSPIEDNHIYRLKIVNEMQIEKIMDIPGSCIFGNSVETNDGERLFCFATAVEPDSTLPTFRYRLTYKLGKSIKDRYSHVFVGNAESGFYEIWKSKKDRMPIWLFQFGNVRYPCQHIKNKIYICPQSCVNKGTYLIELR